MLAPTRERKIGGAREIEAQASALFVPLGQACRPLAQLRTAARKQADLSFATRRTGSGQGCAGRCILQRCRPWPPFRTVKKPALRVRSAPPVVLAAPVPVNFGGEPRYGYRDSHHWVSSAGGHSVSWSYLQRSLRARGRCSLGPSAAAAAAESTDSLWSSPPSNSHNTQFHQTHHTHSLAHRAPSHRRSSLACSLVRSLPRGELCSQWISHFWRRRCAPPHTSPYLGRQRVNTQRFLSRGPASPSTAKCLPCLSLSSWLPMKALCFGK